MPAQTTPNISLKYGWTLGENGWKDDMDANIQAIDTEIQALKDIILDATKGNDALLTAVSNLEIAVSDLQNTILGGVRFRNNGGTLEWSADSGNTWNPV